MTAMPDERGYFGEFGGRFVPEVLMPALEELTMAYRRAKEDPSFQAELDALLQRWAGRPTPLYEAKNLSARQGGARIYLKREDLLHTGNILEALEMLKPYGVDLSSGVEKNGLKDWELIRAFMDQLRRWECQNNYPPLEGKR